MQSTDRYLTARETARYLRVAESTVYRALAKGALPGAKVLGTWRVDREELEAWIKEQRPVPRRWDESEPVPSEEPSSADPSPSESLSSPLPTDGHLAMKIAELKASERSGDDARPGRSSIWRGRGRFRRRSSAD